MTKILAIETSSESASVALLCGESLLSRTLPGSGSAHSGNVLPVIQALLADAGLPLSALDVIAFGRGPGAFTGVRLACGVAQGLSLGLDRPVAAISSLAALALPHADAGRVLCAMDARMNEAYVAAFGFAEGQPQQQGEALCVAPEGLPLPAETGWVAVGTAFAAYAARLPTDLSARLVVRDATAVPLAADVARLAAAQPASWQDAALAAPEYVRNRVALTVAERLAQGGRA